LDVKRGTLEGAGRITADLVSAARIIPGGQNVPGRLSVDGDLALVAPGVLRIRVQRTAGGIDHGQLVVTGAVQLGGKLEVDAPGYAPAAGDVVDIVKGGQAINILGRFAGATLPPPAGGRFMRVQYKGNSVRLAVAKITPGFDILGYPGNTAMNAWRAASPYRWVGYYLKADYHPDTSWLGKRAFLAEAPPARRWGLAILYVGRQASSSVLTASQGKLDAIDAATKTAAEGFVPGSWIYLDIEPSSTSAHPPAMLSYARAWVEEILAGDFYPGIYCARKNLAQLFPDVVAPFNTLTDSSRPSRPRFWVVRTLASSNLAMPPSGSGIPEAVMWQQRIDFNETHGGTTLKIDRNVAVVPDPSSPGE
jgi:hypothetical protein